MRKKIITALLLFFTITSFYSCEKSSLKKYALNGYDGDLTWEKIIKKADWGNRYDHEVAVLNNELFLVGGYDPGKIFGDPYYEDVWKSNNGLDWTNVTEDAEWLGRKGHSLVNFNDGTGEALYLIGGFSVNESTGERAYNNDVWRSVNGENWKEIKKNINVPTADSINWVARMHHKCVVANQGGQNYIYLVGGYTMKTNLEGRYAIQYCNDVWRSTNGVDWAKVGNTDIGIRAEHALTVDENGTMYMQGGQHGVIYVSTDTSSGNPIANYYNGRSLSNQYYNRKEKYIAFSLAMDI